MEGTTVRSVVVFLVFLVGSAVVVHSGGCRKVLGTLSGNELPANSQEAAEQVWIHCGKEMKDRTEAVQIFDRINGYPVHASGDKAESRTWFNKYWPFGFSDVPRRYLESRKDKAQTHAQAPGPAASSPTHARALGPAAPSPRYAPAPGPAAAEPAYDPAPASSPSPILPAPAKKRSPPLPPKLNVSPPPPKVKRPPPAPDSDPPPLSSDEWEYMIIAISVASAAILALAVVLFFICLKNNNNKVDPTDGQRDEKPLLNTGLGGNSSNKDFKTSSVKNNSTDGDGSLILQVQSSEASSGTSQETSTTHQGIAPAAPPPPGPAPPPPPKPPAPRAPPPPKVVRPPPVPLAKPGPHGPHHRGHSSSGGGDETAGEADGQKTKLKPFFWDKVLANPDQSMVWHELKAGSFQVNEEMMESLFGYTPEMNKNDRRKNSSSDVTPQFIQIIDPKKAQNLAILLKALNVTTEEVCDALKEGNELPFELVQSLIKMAPTTEEELKLRLYNGDPSHLGHAERFLKVMVDIPFAFKRMESLCFMSSLQEDVRTLKESFETLEIACTELRNSRLFLKLLEAVLKTGNRMNVGTFRGGAQAFKLDTLLKLSDVKGTDGKTTLLHFVVQEIIRSEGVRAARKARESNSISSINTEDLVEDSTRETSEHYRSLGLQVVSGLSNDLQNVRKAANIDSDGLTSTISKLGHSLIKTREFLNNEMKDLEEDSKFHHSLVNFVPHAEEEIAKILEEEKRIMALVKSTSDYFHGKAVKDEGLRLFVIVRDFLKILDITCKQVKELAAKAMKTPAKETCASTSSETPRMKPLPDVRQRLFPAIKDRRVDDDSSSDDESFSP